MEQPASKSIEEMSLEELRRENEQLRRAVSECEAKLSALETSRHSLLGCSGSSSEASQSSSLDDKALTIVVLGASGDLARKKTFPALFRLFVDGLLPSHALIAGYARSSIPDDEYKRRISQYFSGPEDKKQIFLSQCFYFSGDYDSAESFAKFNKLLCSKEREIRDEEAGANRVFYMAIPPSIFVATAKSIRHHAMSQTGWNRIVVEKPFGRDLQSSEQLGKELANLFTEDQLYRIDHYLGKEMVQNLMVLRFANEVFEPVWNRRHIANVQITFKEDFGTQGRGGYFDEFGIIRDVMQNHLLQMLALVAMEPPVTLSAEDVRDEKAKLLKAIPPIKLEDLVIGQYGPDPKGREGSYLDDPTVPKGSITPTFAAAVLHINNSRWKGTPFILKCGKALNERKAEVRIQFHKPVNSLFVNLNPNELVLRIQPDAAVYLKMTTKKPGLTEERIYAELDLTYGSRFGEVGRALPEAYERLILDVVRGDHNLFVRDDELRAAWAIFTPVLHQLEREQVKPIIYEYGSRGPAEADQLLKRYGYVRSSDYVWRPSQL